MSTKPEFYRGFFEPESAANTEQQPEYRYNHVKETPRGHLFEMDDTPGRERVRISHRANTFIEMHPNGDMVHKVFGDGYEIVVKDKNVLIKGACNITIEGDCNMRVQGDMVQTIEGNYEQHIKGHYKQIVEKTHTTQSIGDMTIGGGYGTGGSITFQTGDALMIDADLSIAGELTAEKITSRTRVDAITGMSAGPLGFVTTEGGVAVGIPVAVPTKVLVATDVIAGSTVDAGVAVNAPTGNFGLMQAIMMTDSVNKSIYNSHIHVSPKGPTGPPSPGPML
jgi:hypothetical protein